MFSGLVETTISLKEKFEFEGVLRLRVFRPELFDDIKVGDSICLNGVCLTLESFTSESMQFALGAETIHVLQLPSNGLFFSRPLNAERSLAFGSRIHGHLVLGHVDSLVRLTERREALGSLILTFELPHERQPLIWKKGSVCLQGVSLTINDVTSNTFSVCLVPETLVQTNLSLLQVGDPVCVEYDWLAKAFAHQVESFVKSRGGALDVG